jgi:hypothetical protein
MRRYILALSILRLILLILGLPGFLNAHEEPMGTPDQYYFFEYKALEEIFSVSQRKFCDSLMTHKNLILIIETFTFYCFCK